MLNPQDFVAMRHNFWSRTDEDLLSWKSPIKAGPDLGWNTDPRLLILTIYHSVGPFSHKVHHAGLT